MSEKVPTSFDSSQDASIEELQTLIDQGLKDNALMIVKFKLGELETVLGDIDKVSKDEDGKIPKHIWEEAKADIEGHIKELNDFLEKNFE